MTQKPLLHIKDLHVTVQGKEILRGLNLEIRPGEIHAIMGPNGSGKSTLAYVLAGRSGYEVTGEILWEGESLLEQPPEERAKRGVFLAFQYPIEVSGVNNAYFLRSALNALRRARGEEEVDAVDFLEQIRGHLKMLGMGEEALQRGVNEGFSGGEKKRNEILQLLTLQPRLAVLDETDSGLDIDALKIVAQGIRAFHTPQRAVLLITHYQRLLDHVVPDWVHVLAGGKIVKSGGRELALELEKKGYAWLQAAGAQR